MVADYRRGHHPRGGLDMTTLEIPLHIPIFQAQQLLSAELHSREVRSVKVTRGKMVITHERKEYEPPQSIGL